MADALAPRVPGLRMGGPQVTAVEYAVAVILASFVCLLAVAASTRVLDRWIDAYRARRRDAAELDAYRRFFDGEWWR